MKLKGISLLLAVALVLAVFAGCTEPTPDYPVRLTAVNFEKKLDYIAPEERSFWSKRADIMLDFWYDEAMSPKGIFYNNLTASGGMNIDEGFHYWVQAQLVDSTVDAYIRTGEREYAQRAKDLIFSVKENNGNHLTNDFYDDMAWMACAVAKLYMVTGDEDLMQDMLVLYEVIMDSWHPDGGIAWSRSTPNYRNAPANGPACIFALRMYDITGEQEYLDMAKKIFDWLDETLVDHESGLVWDGLNRNDDNKIDKGWKFTYCQGVYIGSCIGLYKVTGDENYINKAIKTADYTMEKLAPMRNILQAEGEGDGGAFKGIFCRYFVELIDTTEINREKYVNFLVANAQTMWMRIPSEEEPICAQFWGAPAKLPVQLHVMSSGIALLESVSRIKDAPEKVDN